MVFVDGLGLRAPDAPGNPVRPDVCPALCDLLESAARPCDASLGVPGLPQSATGQTTLLTGVNAAAAMGRHVEGFPGPGLCRIIVRHNLFSRFAAAGRRATFANGYWLASADEARRLTLRSVTTVATLAAFGTVRDRACIERDEAVYQDLTRASLRPRGYDGPLLAPPEAAAHLLRIAREHDFTLFEYFQTDHAGHAQDFERAAALLRDFDAFLAVLARAARGGALRLLLVSDHGNIEDLTVRTHTLNPVPWLVLGPDDRDLRERVASLTDVTPALLALHGVAPRPEDQDGEAPDSAASVRA